MALVSNFAASLVEAASMGQLCASVVLVYCLLRLTLFVRVRARRFRLFELYGIPGPKASLIDGNYRLYRRVAAHHEADDYCRKKYGKTYGIFLGDNPVLTSTDLDFLKSVFLDKADAFQDRLNLPMESPVTQGILVAKYERWKVYHKLMAPMFTARKLREPDSLRLVEESVQLMVDYIRDKFLLSKGPTIRLDVQDLMKATGLHLISHMAINLPVEVKEHEQHVESLDKLLKGVGEGVADLAIPFPFLSGPLELIARNFDFDAALALINRTLNKKINEKVGQLKSSPARSRLSSLNLLDLLIRSHLEGTLSRNEVIANCLNILVAGYDTTSTTLTYVFWALAKHQDIQEKVRDELKVYGRESQYLHQVIKETMRLYPTQINFTSRVANETVEINGITVPQGTQVVHNSWLVHRDPEIWPEPLVFDPDRFLSGAKHHPCAFAPFGLGFRKCLGYQLAMMEMKIIICEILTRYKLRLLSPSDLNLVSYSDVLTKPRDKVILELETLDSGP